MGSSRVRFRIRPARPTPARCVCCGSTLALHQPDPKKPDRLLGTCDECDAWHLVDAARGEVQPLTVARESQGVA